ncbi:MAG TPA: hypothetical protein VHW23_37180 [Kofleriaceae bacterium]|jgi:hypothetical protein|nr:hypothetical protein [Kofleriaceae bacterium]
MLCLTARLAAAVLGLSLAAGCGLISSDVTDFDLALPDKKFSIDASGWQVDTMNARLFNGGKLASVSCSSMQTVCSSAVDQACPSGCTGSCNTMTDSCELSLDVSRPLKVDLVTEQPELKTITDQSVIKVTLDSVTYQVTGNTLDVDTPVIDVYIAPISALTSADPGAELIGSIPAIRAMTTTSSEQTLEFTATGKSKLINIMSMFRTPFNVLVASSLKLTAGQMMPTGRLDAVVRIRGHAGL